MRIRFAIRIAAVALSITPAVAADYGRFPPAPFYAPRPTLRVYSWTGCYLGGQLGGAFADNKVDGDFTGFVFIQNDSATAATIGGQVGCDLQVARNWVAVGAAVTFNAPSSNRWGWTVGLGTEWAVFDHWSVFGRRLTELGPI
jgi:opacity protein-like surface antigen